VAALRLPLAIICRACGAGSSADLRSIYSAIQSVIKITSFHGYLWILP
jgi:hypothetical protein